MRDYPERELNPPEYWTCEECAVHFYLSLNEEPEEDEPILCRECASFDG